MAIPKYDKLFTDVLDTLSDGVPLALTALFTADKGLTARG